MGEFYEKKLNTSMNIADRYRHCSILTDNVTGDTMLATREMESFPPKNSDIYHRLESNEVNRLDIIAYTYYKNPQLWWVIAQANDITDPFREMTAGALIRIPSIDTLYRMRVINR